MKKLLTLILGCLFSLPLFAAPGITVSATAVDILGSSQTISLKVTLIDPNSTGNLRVSGTGVIPVMTASTLTPGTTATVGPVYGNDVILDGFGNLNGTYYLVQVFTVTNSIIASTPSLQNFYAFTGSGTIDLATATPLAPSFMSGVSGSVVVPGNLQAKAFEKVRYADQFATVALAIADACDGANQGVVILPFALTTISATLAIPSFCTIDGQNTAELLAGASLNGPVISIDGKQRVELKGFTVDGNRANNTNEFFGISINNSTDISLDSIIGENVYETALGIIASNTNVNVTNSEFQRSGNPLPSAVGGGVGIDPKNTGCNAHIHFSHNYIHDNNVGVFVGNSTASACTSSDITISNSTVGSNADDGIAFNAYQSGGGLIQGCIVEHVDSGCNGWPANGTGFSASCPAGFLQSGSSASTSGVGVDFVSSRVQKCSASDIHSHDNVFDGVSIDGSVPCTVNTSGTAITATAACFNTAWRKNQAVEIAGVTFLLASSPADSTHLTVTSTAGTHSAEAFLGPSFTYDTIANVVSDNDGAGSVGGGFNNFFADGNVWANSISTASNSAGFFCNSSYNVSFVNDQSYAGGRSGTFSTGFESLGCLEPQFTNIVADDLQASPTQINGLTIDANSTNAIINGGWSVKGSTANISDSGIGTRYSLSKVGSLTTTASATDTLTVNNLTTNSHCTAQATNSTGAGLTGVFMTVSANTATLNHSASASGTFDIYCAVH